MSTRASLRDRRRQQPNNSLLDQSKLRQPALQVRKLNSTPTISPKSSPLRPTRSSASSALHLGKSACTVPEHDAMAKRNEKMRELLKREKESVQAICDEYDKREGQLLREKAQLQQRLDQLLSEKTQQATRHANEIDVMSGKQRELLRQVEQQHQRDLAEQLRKSEAVVEEKTKAISQLKTQIAELMTGQSSTRHHQIEELRNKLIEAAQEANDLKNEIVRFRSNQDDSHRLNQEQQPQVRIGVCMNCIVMQQALSMANAALKAKMRELERIEKVGKGIRLGLELNDLALDQIEKNGES